MIRSTPCGIRNKKARSVAGIWLRDYRHCHYSKTMDGTMANFIVTFRLKSDATYASRYESFVERIHHIAPEWLWEETSSFYAFEAEGTAESICNEIYYNSSFDELTDSLLVIDLGERKSFARGVIKSPARLSFCLGFY